MVQPPKPPPSILLTGAGFSRNWGGWLANEAFEYLLGSPELNEQVRNLLWNCYEDKSGFEGALSRLQKKDSRADERQALTLALRRMFDLMNGAYGKAPGPELGGGYQASKLLGHFDAIFTLNQDELIERRYSPPMPKWSGMRLPGTVLLDPKKGELYDLRTEDNPSNFKLASNFQPYFKLHGSSSFRMGGNSDDALLIMGGEKLASIDGSELLKWYRAELVRHLAIPNTRLLVIGYSFGDSHINELLRHAVTAGTGLKVFIIDPIGVDVLYNRPTSKSSSPPKRAADKLLSELTPAVVGASRRSFETLFRHQQPDEIERAKLYRFLGL